MLLYRAASDAAYVQPRTLFENERCLVSELVLLPGKVGQLPWAVNQSHLVVLQVGRGEQFARFSFHRLALSHPETVLISPEAQPYDVWLVTHTPGLLQPLVGGEEKGPPLALSEGKVAWDPFNATWEKAAAGEKMLLRNAHPDCESRTFFVGVKEGWREGRVWRGQEVKPGRRFEEEVWGEGEEEGKLEVSRLFTDAFIFSFHLRTHSSIMSTAPLGGNVR